MKTVTYVSPLGPIKITWKDMEIVPQVWSEIPLSIQYVISITGIKKGTIVGTNLEHLHFVPEITEGDPLFERGIEVAEQMIHSMHPEEGDQPFSDRRFSQSFDRGPLGRGSMFSRMFDDIKRGSMEGFDEFPGIPRPRKPLSFLTDTDWVRLEAMLLKNQAHQMLELRKMKLEVIRAMNNSAANRVARTIEWFPGYWLIWIVSNLTRYVVYAVIGILELIWWAFSYPFEFIFYAIYPDQGNGKWSCPHCMGTRFGNWIRRNWQTYRMYFTYAEELRNLRTYSTASRLGLRHRQWLSNLVWFVTWPYRRFCEKMQDPDSKAADLIFRVLSPLFSIKFDA